MDQETERRPDSRKLELNAYLTKPTTRLARYPLLLEAVLKQTPDESSDKHDIPKVVTLVREFLAEVNRDFRKVWVDGARVKGRVSPDNMWKSVDCFNAVLTIYIA